VSKVEVQTAYKYTNKEFPRHILNITNDNPSVHKPTEKVAPNKTKDEFPPHLLHPPRIPKKTCHHPHHSPAIHLPRSPWTLTEEKVRDNCRNCPNHKARFRTEYEASYNNDKRCWLHT